MTELYLYNHKIDSVFQLLGEHENDISCSVAWALAKSPSFLQTFIQRITNHKIKTGDTSIHLQQYEANGGFTDIEIELPSKIYIIIEAKRGWNLPKRDQLEKYATRFKHSSALLKKFVVLSECSQEYADLHLETREVAGVQVKPISWKELAAIAAKAYQDALYAEKRLINELLIYLGGLMTMQNLDSNWVYVVALASGTPQGWKISWIDIVREKGQYFHPVGISGWPKVPPNYIAFRYHGKLQSIHHIESYEVITNMHKRIREIKEEEWESHFLYKLGPAFGPEKEVRTGRIYRNGRVRCMLDTLFTCNTISEARDVSQEREQQQI